MNLYVSTRSAALLKAEDGVFLDGVGLTDSFELNLTTISIEEDEDGNADGTNNAAPKPEIRFRIPKGQSDDRSPLSVREGTNLGISIDIGIYAYKNTPTTTKYISFEHDSRFEYRSKEEDSTARTTYFLNRENVRCLPVDAESKPIQGRDAIDNVFAKFYFPGTDPWTHHFHKNEQEERNRKHILDFIDDCIREFAGLESSAANA